MSLNISLDVSQPSYFSELPTPFSDYKSRSSTTVTIPSQSTRKTNSTIKTKFPISTEANEPDKNYQIQPLIDLLRDSASKGSLRQAKSVHGVFDKMSQRNIFSWTVMIVGSTENGFFIDGFNFFCQMINDGIRPDSFALSAITQTCIGLDCVELGFTLNGFHSEAFDHFLRMKNEGILPNMYTLISVSKAVGQLGDVDKGKEVESLASELGMESNVQVGTALIDMYSKCGSLREARSIFDSNFTICGVNMPWNAMISGYSQNECSQESLELYIRMCKNDIKSDVYTYCSVFNAIASSKYLQFGNQVHGMVLKSGSDMLVISVYNAIVDAYAKCGALVDVRKIFDRMEERNIVSWTTLVTAHSQCSQWEEALANFSQMRKEGFIPNQFTFSSVLRSCSGLCFLEYGQQVHGLICKVGLESDKCIESALVDMYAKCGSITMED
ncbi:hypothetical protein QYF36_024077 [Acer negundo]|nr:hypothetical protein QYF36_024077 [Acer negundo]